MAHLLEGMLLCCGCPARNLWPFSTLCCWRGSNKRILSKATLAAPHFVWCWDLTCHENIGPSVCWLLLGMLWSRRLVGHDTLVVSRKVLCKHLPVDSKAEIWDAPILYISIVEVLTPTLFWNAFFCVWMWMQRCSLTDLIWPYNATYIYWFDILVI